MISLTPNVIAIWFLCGGYPRDWMACLSRREDGHGELTYRIRYYDKEDPGNDPHSGKDKKSWRTSITRDPITEASIADQIKDVREAAQAMADVGFQPPGYKLYEVVNNGDFEAFVAEFLKLPFVHARDASEEERTKIERAVKSGGFHVG